MGTEEGVCCSFRRQGTLTEDLGIPAMTAVHRRPSLTNSHKHLVSHCRPGHVLGFAASGTKHAHLSFHGTYVAVGRDKQSQEWGRKAQVEWGVKS